MLHNIKTESSTKTIEYFYVVIVKDIKENYDKCEYEAEVIN